MMRHGLILLLGGLLMLPAHAETPAVRTMPAIDAAYDVEWNGIGLGEARVRLLPDEGAGCYRYETVTDPIGLVRWLYGSPRETSRFCLVDGVIQARSFEYQINGDDDFALRFDWAQGLVYGPGEQQRALPAGAVDRQLVQLVVRDWVIAHLDTPPQQPVDVITIDDDSIKTYSFAIAGRETIDTAAGKFETIIVKRVDPSSRSITFWLAPERDYMPVKVLQTKDGKPQLRLQIRK